MPELPEVETVRCGLAPAMVGARIAAVVQRRADLRFPLPARFAARLTGRRVERLERRAKYLLAYLDADEVLTMHLGMTGRFTVAWPGGGNGGGIERPGLFTHEAGGEDRHDHIVFEMSTGVRVTYNDARRFGYMDLVPAAGLETHKHFKGLGVEPLSEALTPAYLAAAARARRVDLKALLLDQRVIAGLGNIYVVEALFRAGLRPSRPAATLADRSGAPRESAVRLVATIREVLGEAIAAGGSSLRDYRQASGEPGAFQGAHAVYDREGEPCLRPGCRGTIRRSVQGGRSSFYCARCQR